MGEANEERCFGQTKITGRFVKKAGRGGLDPVGSSAVRNVIEIHLEDLVFAVQNLGKDSKDCLFDFASHSSLGSEERDLDKLLGDG